MRWMPACEVPSTVGGEKKNPAVWAGLGWLRIEDSMRDVLRHAMSADRPPAV